ncbi:hypothetical protein CPB86DRAFT_789849 [Serendipita vermifera]|nr:hypothetical protein CPB86DRAFT_789849 [Serendipita vermifera]
MPQNMQLSSNPFDKLPDEIIEMITENLNETQYWGAKKNVHNFASCDRRLRRINLPILYHEIHLITPAHIYLFFQHILDFPQYAALVKIASLLCFYHNPWHHPDSQKLLQKADLSRIIKEARSRSLPPDIVAKVEERADWAVALCLLPLLTHLEGFHIQPGDTNIDDIDEHFPRLFSPRLLSPCLRWVYLDVDGWDWTPLSVELLIPFFLLPSVTQVSACQMESKIQVVENHLLIPFCIGKINAYNQSNVESLRLYDCRVSEEALTTLLKLPKALKHFVFLGENGYGSPISLEQFQQALNHVSNTLDTLMLQFDDISLEFSPVWSLSHFEVLKTLSISYKLLFSRKMGDIDDRLPPSLETLVLRVLQLPRYVDITVTECVKIILTQKSSIVLPHLKVLAVNHQLFDWSQFTALASEKGVEIGRYDVVPDR